jgi:hypothetical protein
VPPVPAVLALVAAALTVAGPAAAHGFTSTVYADVTARSGTTVRTEVGLEYDLLVVSVAEHEEAPAFFEDGMAVFGTGDEKSALDAHADEVVRYVTERFAVTADGRECTARQAGDLAVEQRDGVPYAVLTLDHSCPAADAHEVRSTLFPDAEGYVRGTVTVVQYDLDGSRGSAALDAAEPSFSTQQPVLERFREFFLLGAEHLLSGIDHILFLLALIVGSRRLRDVVLAASAFTLAHSVTFVLAALGLVQAPAAVVEPVIALSIAVVAAWHLWGLHRSRPLGSPATAQLLEPARAGRLGLQRADWARLAVVFCFGLVHGLGFAGALGIDEAFSWRLLWSLLVFNVGIEVVQIAIIAVLFPLLTLVRRHAPRAGTAAGAVVAAVVAAMGLVWFVQRVLGLG